ncbi:MAG: Hca operon transcriptional activator HcaR [Candidatus Celerinatantimonas neptuna]|nr:MAG: Hca operon transcriptional activator HcaR [Candidatus Celerinatantimonas neptuna]
MEFHYLKYFVAVAETKNFSQASRQLGIAQPPLSQQIKKLEQEVGVPLFNRLSRGVELTSAGKTLYPDALRILNDVKRSMAKAQQVARGELNQLSVGFSSSTVISDKILMPISRFHTAYPDIQITPVESSMPELIDMICKKEVDIAFLRLPCYSVEQLETYSLYNDPFVAVIPVSNPLCQYDEICLEQLVEESLLLFPRQTGPGIYDALRDTLINVGVSADGQWVAPQLRSTISMAIAGLGIAVVPYSLTEHLSAQVKVLPITDMPLISRVILAWHKMELNQQVRRFVAATKSMIETP